MVVHGGVDGYSRVPVYLHCSNNNKACKSCCGLGTAFTGTMKGGENTTANTCRYYNHDCATVYQACFQGAGICTLKALTTLANNEIKLVLLVQHAQDQTGVLTDSVRLTIILAKFCQYTFTQSLHSLQNSSLPMCCHLILH